MTKKRPTYFAQNRTGSGLSRHETSSFFKFMGNEAFSGFMVFLWVLPFSLGISIAAFGTEVSPIFGLITSVIGGLVISFIMDARLTIKGPSAGMIVMVGGAVAAFGSGTGGWHLTLGAIAVAGLFQIIFGLLKMGDFTYFFPTPVIYGLLTTMGLIVMAKQLNLLFGIDPGILNDKAPLQLIDMLPVSIMHENAHMAEIGLACLLILVVMDFIRNQHIKKIPQALVILAVSIPLGIALHIKTDGTISNFSLVRTGGLDKVFQTGILNADISGFLSHTSTFIQYVVLFFVLGSSESLLTARLLDLKDPNKRKTNFSKELIAVGFGNLICGIFGGLPMVNDSSAGMANVTYGARSHWSNFFNGLFILLALVLAVPVIESIPSAALAALLIYAGFRLAHPRKILYLWRLGKDQFIIFIATVVISLSVGLLAGLISGIVLEMIINVFLGARFSNLFKSRVEVYEQGNQIQLDIKGDAVFSNYPGLKKKLSALPQGKHISLNLSNCGVIDHPTLHLLNDFKNQYQEEGGMVIIGGYFHHRNNGQDLTSTRAKKF